ncbi:MAG: bifunctional phosphoglucose/phosphomannose isomerase [Euryarchaeota archaeon]|nr:bifunctional phosphoglucose/phosphomannose isomerase [Euryarchaeota archaeon]
MNMKEMIERFPKLIEEGWSLGESVKAKRNVSKVVFLGMGGSAISGEIISEVGKLESKIPMEVVKGYEVPRYVNRRTLVVAISYSGNTEETVTALQEALLKGAMAICVSSGGEIEEIAQERGLEHIKVPSGYAPRAALPLLLFSVLNVLVRSKLIKKVNIENVIEAVSLVSPKDAEDFARRLKGRTPVIYGSGPFRAVAKRWANQFNENSKILAFWGEFPEMNHNEIVGWYGDDSVGNFAPIILESGVETERVKLRYDLTEKLALKRAGFVFRYRAQGSGLWERIMNTIYFGDWVSYNLAILRNVDPLPVEVISRLKKELSSR